MCKPGGRRARDSQSSVSRNGGTWQGGGLHGFSFSQVKGQSVKCQEEWGHLAGRRRSCLLI